MVWVSLIITILSDLPQLISIFKAIIAAIHGQPLSQRFGHIQAFETALAGWATRVKTEPDQVEAEVKAHGRQLGLAI